MWRFCCEYGFRYPDVYWVCESRERGGGGIKLTLEMRIS
jgi:hypothetical protein